MQYHTFKGKYLLMNFSQIVFCSILVFTIFMRLLELKIANSNLSNRLKTTEPIIIKEPYYFLFIILHVSFLIFLPLEVFLLERSFKLFLGVTSIIIFLIALSIRIHVLKILGNYWNVKIVYDQNPNSIITKGIYRYIRHPNYLIVILEFFSLSMFHSAYISMFVFSVLNFIILYFRIKKEESHLFLNSEYKKHFQNKKRFIPGIF